MGDGKEYSVEKQTYVNIHNSMRYQYFWLYKHTQGMKTIQTWGENLALISPTWLPIRGRFIVNTVKFRFTTGPIIQPSANYDHFFLVPNFPLSKSMVVGPNNATVPLLRITTTFSGPNGMFIVCLGSTNETTFTVVYM